MSAPTPTRRERHRARTVSEIKEIALRHVVAGGREALSLRAVAREMGMAPAGLYNYFATREALLDALTADAYASLADSVEHALESCPAGDTAARILAFGLAYRAWAISHPTEFRLVYSEPASAAAIASGSTQAAEHRVCLCLLSLAEGAWPTADALVPQSTYTWSDLDNDPFTPVARAAHPELPPAAIALTLRIWGRIHGLVALEVLGMHSFSRDSAARVLADEMRDVARSLGV